MGYDGVSEAMGQPENLNRADSVLSNEIERCGWMLLLNQPRFQAAKL